MTLPQDWTLGTLEVFFVEQLRALRELVDEREGRNKERLDDAKEIINAAMASADKALMKAETAAEKRFEGVNEFRAALSDQTNTLLPRSEYRVAHEAIVEKVDTLRARVITLETADRSIKETKTTSVGNIVATVSVMYGIMATIGVIATLILRAH